MKKNLGFTLIELLVVISMIALLSSIVLAAVQDSRDKARQTAFRQYLAQLSKSVELYRLENGVLPPNSSNLSTTGSGSLNTYLGSYIDILTASEVPSFAYLGIVGLSNGSTISCGAQNTGSDFFIYFYSDDPGLNFRKAIENRTGNFYMRGTRFFYCSDSVYN